MGRVRLQVIIALVTILGLALVLGFIAVKLILEAMHETTDLDVPEISIAASLAVIIGILAVTAIASIVAVRRNPELATTSAEAYAEHEAAVVAGEAIAHLGPHTPAIARSEKSDGGPLS